MSAFADARDFLLRHRGDRDAAVEGFRWPEDDTFNWALDHFDALARAPGTGDADALHIVGDDGSESRRTFAELGARSAQVANHLRRLGVQRGDRVLLMLGNELPLWELMLAAFKLGAVVIPASTLLTTVDLRDRLDRGRVRHLAAASVHAEKFAALGGTFTRIAVGAPVMGWQRFDDAEGESTTFEPDGPTRADDPMLLYFTSGTTAQPKLVLHTHRSYPVGHLSTMYWLGLQPGDRHLNISSPGWAKHAWSCFFAPWNAGACVFVHNAPRFSAERLLATLAAHRVTSLCAPPTVWRMLIQEDLPAWRERLALREVIGAGEPLNPEIIERVRAAWGLVLRDGYGQTETTALVGNCVGQALQPGSMGRPLPGYRIDLLDADGRAGDEGEICVALDPRPAGLMAGYQDGGPEADAATQGRHYRTGDVATRDADGNITFVGRADDVFKASDYRISPFELESVLIAHAAVAEAAVVPAPDALRLAVPKAYVILRAGTVAGPALAADILAFARRELAAYKRVRRVEFVAELPKTISGKIRRVQLRAQEIERHGRQERGADEHREEDFAPAISPSSSGPA